MRKKLKHEPLPTTGQICSETELFYRGILPFLLLKREVETLIVVYSALLLLPGLPKPVAEKLLK